MGALRLFASQGSLNYIDIPYLCVCEQQTTSRIERDVEICARSKQAETRPQGDISCSREIRKSHSEWYIDTRGNGFHGGGMKIRGGGGG